MIKCSHFEFLKFLYQYFSVLLASFLIFSFLLLFEIILTQNNFLNFVIYLISVFMSVMYSQALSLCAKVKERLNSAEDYQTFLKCLNIFGNGIIKKNDLQNLVCASFLFWIVISSCSLQISRTFIKFHQLTYENQLVKIIYYSNDLTYGICYFGQFIQYEKKMIGACIDCMKGLGSQKTASLMFIASV